MSALEIPARRPIATISVRQVRLPDALDIALERHCDRTGKPDSDIIRDAVASFLADAGTPLQSTAPLSAAWRLTSRLREIAHVPGLRPGPYSYNRILQAVYRGANYTSQRRDRKAARMAFLQREGFVVCDSHGGYTLQLIVIHRRICKGRCRGNPPSPRSLDGRMLAESQPISQGGAAD